MQRGQGWVCSADGEGTQRAALPPAPCWAQHGGTQGLGRGTAAWSHPMGGSTQPHNQPGTILQLQGYRHWTQNPGHGVLGVARGLPQPPSQHLPASPRLHLIPTEPWPSSPADLRGGQDQPLRRNGPLQAPRPAELCLDLQRGGGAGWGQETSPSPGKRSTKRGPTSTPEPPTACPPPAAPTFPLSTGKTPQRPSPSTARGF